jgi:hypothetical protein
MNGGGAIAPPLVRVCGVACGQKAQPSKNKSHLVLFLF